MYLKISFTFSLTRDAVVTRNSNGSFKPKFEFEPALRLSSTENASSGEETGQEAELDPNG